MDRAASSFKIQRSKDENRGSDERQQEKTKIDKVPEQDELSERQREQKLKGLKPEDI